jgi:hypothetical protein
MIRTTHHMSIRGKGRQVQAFRLDDLTVVTRGKFVKVAEIFDEYWLPANTLPDPNLVLQGLRGIDQKPDLFTFTQRVPNIEPRFKFHFEWDNVAAIPVSSYDRWFREQISSASRRNIRASEKRGVVVRAERFDEKYVRGIMSIFNESPIRAGRQYWHYGKDFSAVDAENGTYHERSTFLGAYLKDEMIGYMKIVWDTRTAAIMQILSKVKFLDHRPNNALLSAAVKLCSERKIEYLLYEKFVYGNKGADSLTKFKESNGFVRMDLPRYYISLTPKGNIALRLGLHRNPKDLVPQWLRRYLLEYREKWYTRRVNVK